MARGRRGSGPFSNHQAAESHKDSAPAPVVAAALEAVQADEVVMSHADRNNPAKLSGVALRDFGYRVGMARSDMETMSDEKLREQLRYIAYRQYDR